MKINKVIWICALTFLLLACNISNNVLGNSTVGVLVEVEVAKVDGNSKIQFSNFDQQYELPLNYTGLIIPTIFESSLYEIKHSMNDQLNNLQFISNNTDSSLHIGDYIRLNGSLSIPNNEIWIWNYPYDEADPIKLSENLTNQYVWLCPLSKSSSHNSLNWNEIGQWFFVVIGIISF